MISYSPNGNKDQHTRHLVRKLISRNNTASDVQTAGSRRRNPARILAPELMRWARPVFPSGLNLNTNNQSYKNWLMSNVPFSIENIFFSLEICYIIS